MHDIGCSGLVHWDDPEGWYGEGSGRGLQDGEHMYIRGRFMSMYDQTNTILQSEKERKKKKKQNLKRVDTNELIKTGTDLQTQRVNLWLPVEKSRGRKVESGGEHTHIAVVKMDNQQGPTV